MVVKRLSSLEDLGNITLLCTDKTGTLTEGKMSVQQIAAEDQERLQLLAAAVVESEGETHPSPYDAALLAFIPPEIQEQARGYRQVQGLPFDPKRRRRCVVLEESSTHARALVVLGAVEILIGLSDGEPERKEQYLAQAASDGKQGLRDLGLASRELLISGPIDILQEEQHLTFLGVVTLADPLRPTAKLTIERAESLGVAIKILSGDSREKDLGVLINGIDDGRTIFLNIEKYLKYTLVGNWGNFFALAILYLFSLNLPLLPVQVLLTSLITDLPLITIASDRVESNEVQRPERYNMRSLMVLVLVLGVPTALFELLFFALVNTRSLLFVQNGCLK